MNISVEKKPANVMELAIIIEPGDYGQAVETALKKQRQNAAVPGFRKGTAPMGLIKKMYEQPILGEEVHRMMTDKLFDYIKEQNIEYICEPMPVEGKFAQELKNGETFTFTFEIAEQPKFEIDFTKIPKVEICKITAADDEMENYVKHLQERYGKYISPEENGTEESKVEPAELNDDFYAKAFPNGEVKDEKALKVFAAQEIEKVWKQETDKKFMNDAIEAVIEDSTVEIPEDFVKRYLVATQKNINAEDLEKNFAEYRKAFKWQLIESYLTKRFEIKIEREDIKNYIRSFFVYNYFQGIEPEEMKEQLDNLVENSMKQQKDVKQIYDTLFDEKLKGVLLEQIPTKEKKITSKKFIELMTPKTEK